MELFIPSRVGTMPSLKTVSPKAPKKHLLGIQILDYCHGIIHIEYHWPWNKNSLGVYVYIYFLANAACVVPFTQLCIHDEEYQLPSL